VTSCSVPVVPDVRADPVAVSQEEVPARRYSTTCGVEVCSVRHTTVSVVEGSLVHERWTWSGAWLPCTCRVTGSARLPTPGLVTVMVAL
jgi:hypothetical protein